MKLLTSLLFLLSLTFSVAAVAQAPNWPKDYKSGKVTFRGSYVWPRKINKPEEQKAFVRKWYLANLTDQSESEIDADAQSSFLAKKDLVTYGGLPKVASFGSQTVGANYYVSYQAIITATPKGFSYALTNFNFNTVDEGETLPIEDLVTSTKAAEQAALKALRARIDGAAAALK